MPIDRKLGLLFVHIPKTAGTSIEELLGVRGDWRCENVEICFGLIQSSHLLKENFSSNFLQHLTYAELKRLLAQGLEGLLPFAVVRDPWTRLLSSFQRKDPDLCTSYQNRYGRDLHAATLPEYIDIASTFDHPHLRSQTRFLQDDACPGQPSADIKLFKHECLGELEQWLGSLADKELRLPRKNVNLPKQNLPDLTSDHWALLEKSVRQIYQHDCKNFGYPMS